MTNSVSVSSCESCPFVDMSEPGDMFGFRYPLFCKAEPKFIAIPTTLRRGSRPDFCPLPIIVEAKK